MKLTSLLAQYLYTKHRLDLPGIGSFLLDPSTISVLENSKQRSTVLEGVSFEPNSPVKEPKELIEYISSQTGKMKALATADLDSHIQLAQQFLNIGKPYTFEGIGTLVKTKTGSYDFTPLSVPTEKLKESNKAKEPAPVSLEESSTQYESFLASPKSKFNWGKPAVALLILAGIGLAVWGGYTISKKAATNDVTEVIDPPKEEAPVVTDSLPKEPAKPTDYKYVLQVSKKQTALRRFNQLKSNMWDVKMETNDSVNYKLYMLLPALNADTTRTLDSLMAMTGKKVYIEPQN